MKFGKVKRVTSMQMELELQEAECLLFLLGKARTQMITDGSNTAERVEVLDQMEHALIGVLGEEEWKTTRTALNAI